MSQCENPQIAFMLSLTYQRQTRQKCIFKEHWNSIWSFRLRRQSRRRLGSFSKPLCIVPQHLFQPSFSLFRYVHPCKCKFGNVILSDLTSAHLYLTSLHWVRTTVLHVNAMHLLATSIRSAISCIYHERFLLHFAATSLCFQKPFPAQTLCTESLKRFLLYFGLSTHR